MAHVVFISWSGRKAEAVGHELKRRLAELFEQDIAWMSKQDIDVGMRSNREIDRALEGIHFGIICCTCVSVASPWVLFEAGAIAKDPARSRPYVYLIDMVRENLPKPLQQFQTAECTRAGTWDLVRAIHKSLQGDPEPTPAFRKRFDGVWRPLKTKLLHLPEENVPLNGLLASSKTPLLTFYGSSEDRKLEGGEVAPTIAIATLVERYGSPFVKGAFRARVGHVISPGERRDSNLVLIGGPRSNDMVGQVFNHKKCPIFYTDDHGYKWKKNGKVYRQPSNSPTGGEVFEDYGYLMRLPSRWNEQNRMVMIGGLSSRAEDGVAELILDDKVKPRKSRDCFAMLLKTTHIGNCLQDYSVVENTPVSPGKCGKYWTA